MHCDIWRLHLHHHHHFYRLHYKFPGFHSKLNEYIDGCQWGVLCCHVIRIMSSVHLTPSVACVTVIAITPAGWLEVPHSLHTVLWGSRKNIKYSLSQGFTWTLRSRRWQQHFQRNRVCLSVVRGVSLQCVKCLGVGPTANLTSWGIQENNSPVKSAHFFCEFQEIMSLPLSIRFIYKYLQLQGLCHP